MRLQQVVNIWFLVITYKFSHLLTYLTTTYSRKMFETKLQWQQTQLTKLCTVYWSTSDSYYVCWKQKSANSFTYITVVQICSNVTKCG